jgi:hypothetical protein
MDFKKLTLGVLILYTICAFASVAISLNPMTLIGVLIIGLPLIIITYLFFRKNKIGLYLAMIVAIIQIITGWLYFIISTMPIFGSGSLSVIGIFLLMAHPIAMIIQFIGMIVMSSGGYSILPAIIGTIIQYIFAILLLVATIKSRKNFK